MSLIHAVILGIIEGITEFLPVSSTGHLILASNILGISQTDFVKTFEIAIQLGAILAVIILYGKRLISEKDMAKKVLVAFIPTGILGFILYKLVKTFLMGNEWVTLVSLFVVGVLLIAFELFYKKDTQQRVSTGETKNISYKQSLVIGTVQSLAMVPGVSRSGATILGGLALGIERKAIVEFSFLLAIPTMLAATGYDLLKSASSFSSDQFLVLAVGLVVSFIVALPVIKFFIKFVQKNTFIPFGIYRIILSVLFAIYLFLK